MIPSNAFNFPTCQSFNLTTGQCDEFAMTVAVINYVPAFTYNHQCSSTLFVDYIPVFVYTYVSYYLTTLFSGAIITSLKKASIPKLLVSVLPGLLWPAEAEDGLGRLIRMDGIIVTVMNNFIVLLTFGLASPLLAGAIIIGTLLQTYEWQILFGR